MVSFKSIATVFSLGVAANAVALESRQLGDCNVLSCVESLPLVGPLEECALLGAVDSSVLTTCLGDVVSSATGAAGGLGSLNLPTACLSCLPLSSL